MLPERSGKQQQQQLSRKVSAGQAISHDEGGALREQRVSGAVSAAQQQPRGLAKGLLRTYDAADRCAHA